MGGMTAEAQVAKKCYRNQTAGWLGVVKLDHLGAQRGHSIEPYGTVWLTDEEAILTARAPANPKDNPFVEQPFLFEDGQGVRSEKPMRPLVLIEDDREVPSGDRYVPGLDDVEDAVAAAPSDLNLPASAAAARDAQAALDADSDREVPSEASKPILAPSSAAAVPPSHARPGVISESAPAAPEADKAESWVDNPDRTAEPQQGSLGGSSEPAPSSAGGDPARDGSQTQPPPQAPVRQPVAPPVQTAASADVPSQKTVPSESAGVREGAGSPSEQGGKPAPEETAAQTASGEETGAADTPVGEPPAGEFASHEEVGSPDAPTQSGESA